MYSFYNSREKLAKCQVHHYSYSSRCYCSSSLVRNKNVIKNWWRKHYDILWSFEKISVNYMLGRVYIYKILEVNLFAFAYRLFHEDFSSIIGDFCIGTHSFFPASSSPLSTLPLVIPEYIWIVIYIYIHYVFINTSVHTLFTKYRLYIEFEGKEGMKGSRGWCYNMLAIFQLSDTTALLFLQIDLRS